MSLSSDYSSSSSHSTTPHSLFTTTSPTDTELSLDSPMMTLQYPPSPKHSPATAHSIGGMIEVLEYSPNEGEVGVPVVVRIHMQHDRLVPVYLRIVFGTKALNTIVQECASAPAGTWSLRAEIPPLPPHHIDPSRKIFLSVQALSEDSIVIDSVTFGEFYLWGHNPQVVKQETHDDLDHVGISSLRSAPITRRRAVTLNSLNPAPKTTRGRRNKSPTPATPSSSHHPSGTRAISLMRTRYPIARPSSDDLHVQAPVVDIVTPFDDMCSNWSDTELKDGRRLVQFRRVQDGRKLIISCEPLAQDDFNQTSSVISCIYRRELGIFYVTSVDVIYLLECITATDFPVEEKNRIRRNLEGLKPTTVSKHKPGFEKFFQRIMDFPDPKPRNIEKDLKVFEWSQLGAALDKILSKYSVYSESSPSGSSVSLPRELPDEYPQLVMDEPECRVLEDPEEMIRGPAFLTKVEHSHDLMFYDSGDYLTPECQSSPLYMKGSASESPEMLENVTSSLAPYGFPCHSPEDWSEMFIRDPPGSDFARVFGEGVLGEPRSEFLENKHDLLYF